MKSLVAALVLVHALLHLLGFAKAFQLVELDALKIPIGRAAGVGWLLGAVVLGVVAGLVAIGPRPPNPLAHARWALALVGALLSQTLIVASWSDAKFGTLPNVVLVAIGLVGVFVDAPIGLRGAYRERSAALLADVRPGERLPDARLAELPPAIRRYLEVTHTASRPVPSTFRARWRGRIRGGPDDAWMTLEAEQVNAVVPATRLFFLEATKMGLPAIGLHAYEGDEARMDVRLLGVVPVARAHGRAATKAETVTLFNDLAVLAPAALAILPIRWTELAPDRVRGEFVNAGHRIAAELVFDRDGMLCDFVSDDRGRESNGAFVETRWSTPLSSPRDFGPIRLSSRGEGRWAPTGSDSFAYIELELVDVDYDPAR